MSARLLQLASPALPIGGFSYSAALEWAIESGQVHDATSAHEWIDDVLALSLAGFELPLMVAALRCVRADVGGRQADALVAWNERAIAARETPELRQESLQMGFSLARWVRDVCPSPQEDEQLFARLQPVSLPIAWALAASRLALGEREAALCFAWSFVENQAMVLMKALPLGQIAAQRLLLALGPRVEASAERSLGLAPDDWSNAAPALALWSIRHESQYSRLFRS